ncbi:hypothetical protein N7462_006737 [Penicillium macrosclerotiorum]|uniref:uncharacterized protein n=1 Tax=Penicillium macrosclerotiorum TaxID=303699 RepID=UPI002546877C|nr:uncharacterized protein N7462_006737 [Penicillium macrosclerotiorum]KAJ5683572.1 hypothetical protein N7462_006737 [Penicillium macrosclerotiorum]
MAAPNSKDSMNLVGTWHLNRTLSDDPDKIFALQGVPWVVRQILRYASLSLHISQAVRFPDGTTTVINENNSDIEYPIDSIMTLHIKQTVYPGGFNSEGSYPVNGTSQDLSLPIFGEVMMKLRYVNTSSVPDEKLRSLLSQGSPSKMAIDELAHNSSKGWQAQVWWGFEWVGDTRYFTRNATVTRNKDGQTVTSRMVYDFLK